MKCLLLANGEYGDITIYYSLVQQMDIVLCADGGANYAYQMGITPDCILGDLDSIDPQVKDYFISQKVLFKEFPPAKDFTDTQLTLELAWELGADEIICLGTLGGRLDHTMANLYSCMEAARQGKKIIHFGPQVTVYMITGPLRLRGRRGDTVSLIVLSEKAEGVTLQNFVYPLTDALLLKENPYAVSNRMADDTAEINLASGVIAVFHYRS
ncbi:MAG: thiamine diphosphokinase [Syntrophomonadaceae bacterium]|jgi:thiamine pyrophosphokinase|nr:thiamine diphosphokinase [Syntrophomonadaceae bacterium]